MLHLHPTSLFFLFSRIYCSFFLAGLTILLYDHILTLRMEVKYIWSSKLRPSTCWFLAVRYCRARCEPHDIGVLFWKNGTRGLRQNATGVGGSPRHPRGFNRVVFAMYGLNLWISDLPSRGGGPCRVAALWAAVKYGHPQMLSDPGLTGCHTAIPRVSAIRLAGAWEAQLVCDTLVFALTVRRAYIQRRTSLRYRGTLVERMVTDGGMYFGIIVLANVANLLTFYVGDVLLSGFLSWFTTRYPDVTLITKGFNFLFSASQ
ncbi:hypothetical protein B0H14DRAFT_1087057 [Mycena olivaceomarginata]|nr:hypothetical protein B0H14DRAFT_1087057 [Mycena olivaceomarginata]